MKSFSLCMCSVFLIGFEDLKVFSFPLLSYSFFFSLATPNCLHSTMNKSSVFGDGLTGS